MTIKMSMIKNWSPDALNELANVLHAIDRLHAKDGELVLYPSDEELNRTPSPSSLSSEAQRNFIFAIQGEGAIKITHEYTLGRREMPYRWSLEVTNPRFKELESEVEQLYLDNCNAVELFSQSSQQKNIQQQGKLTPLSKRDLKKEINRIIKTRKLGKKEIDFLKFLAKDFQPKTIEEISKQVSTKDCKHLKGRVKKKIKGMGFFIKTIKASGWGGKSYYQLEYLPTSDNQ